MSLRALALYVGSKLFKEAICSASLFAIGRPAKPLETAGRDGQRSILAHAIAKAGFSSFSSVLEEPFQRDKVRKVRITRYSASRRALRHAGVPVQLVRS